VDQLHWNRVGELFAQARLLDGERQNSFLKLHCCDDQDLFEQVHSLLRIDAQPGLLDSPPTDSTFPIQQVIAGRFRIIRHIAVGGMGSVYEAEDLRLNDRVALKMIRSDVASDPRALERFRREILLGKRVTHPNVCRIHDLGVDHLDTGTEILFLTMQFLPGETLAERIKRGPMPEAEALPLIEDMVDALCAAHEAKVIHRDFKSSNVILVTSAKRICAVVTDFGLARGLHDDRSLTSTSIVGTVDYMAPEQIRGGEVSPATDIYALGIVMYEMITGQRPFIGDSKVTVALKHLNDEPKPARDLIPGLHPNWDATILACLRKVPSERFHSAADVKSSLVQNDARTRSRLRKRLRDNPLVPRLIVIVIIVLVLPITLSFLFFKHQQVPSAQDDRSIVVLPFQESGDTPESFSFGFTEEVMNALGQVPDLRVIGPETSFRFKASKLSAIEIGNKLKAHYLLIGSVHRANHQVQVIVRIVDTKDGSQVWSRDMSREERDVLLLPDDIARTLSRKMNISLTGTKLSGQPIDAGGLTARDLYWTGRFLFHQRSDQSVQKSLEYFRQAVKHDPNFAEAYSGIADALIVLAERNLVSTEDGLAEARQAAKRAVELNNRLPAAYVSLAQITSVYDRDLESADQLFRHALALDPRLASGWQWLSYQLAKQRRFHEAVQAAETAVFDDPLSNAANINLAVVYYYAGLDDRAIQQSRKQRQMDPESPLSNLIIAEIFARKGLSSEAVHELESVPEDRQDHPMVLRVAVEIYAQAGMKKQAEQALGRLLAHSRSGGVPPSYVAAAYAALGDKENAFLWLKRACDERDPFASVANAYPAFDVLRSDPRWAPLMGRLGIKAKTVSDSSAPASSGGITSQASPGHRIVGPGIEFASGAASRESEFLLPAHEAPGASDQPVERPALIDVLGPKLLRGELGYVVQVLPSSRYAHLALSA
jgi:eukaryotic-like serine/threonine-protein kinase